jgi:hypothetical protein
MKFSSVLKQIAKEPPFRLLVKLLLTMSAASVRTKANWDVSPRPPYLVGVLRAADEAARVGISEISVIEFGVAGGEGLLALQEIADAVEAETKVRIVVYGFDTGKGLPDPGGDFRDHPDCWKSGDFPMDELRLKEFLSSRSNLVLGDVADTVPAFVQKTQSSPIGFIAMDLDLYSSTRAALQILAIPGKQMLLHVPIYFDDVAQLHNHRFAGELLAIEEFNAENDTVKIDQWRGITDDRAFPENGWLKRMYLAHDLKAISRATPFREPLRLHERKSDAVETRSKESDKNPSAKGGARVQQTRKSALGSLDTSPSTPHQYPEEGNEQFCKSEKGL